MTKQKFALFKLHYAVLTIMSRRSVTNCAECQIKGRRCSRCRSALSTELYLTHWLYNDLQCYLANTTFEEYSLAEKQDMIESLRLHCQLSDCKWKRRLEYVKEIEQMQMHIMAMDRLHVQECALEKQSRSIEVEEKETCSKRLELLKKITREQLEAEVQKEKARMQRKERRDMIVQKRLLMNLKHCPSNPIKPIPPSDPLPSIRSPVRNNYVQPMPATGKMPSLTTGL